MVIRLGIPNRPQQIRTANEEALQRATLAIQNQRPIDAERIGNEILKANPGHLEAAKVVGFALLMQGRAKEAIVLLEQSSRRSNDPTLDTQLAIALRRVGREDDAIIALRRAIKRRPPFPAAFHELGFLFLSRDRHDEAIEILKHGLKLMPNMPELLTLLGVIYFSRNDRLNARNAFMQALAISPFLTDAQFGLSRTLAADGEYAQAAKIIRQLVLSNPNDVEARIFLGACLLEIGQSDAAYTCFRVATGGGPQFYGKALASLAKSSHGRFWIKPSAAAQFIRGDKI